MLYDKIQLENDEQIIAQVRRHWFVPFSQLLTLCIGAVLPAVLYVIAPYVLPFNLSTFNLNTYSAYVTFAYAVFVFFLWTQVFSIWTNYYLDLLTLTDRRIILINQKGFFRRNIASFRLERLQDMNVEINGIIATLLDFGTLTVETAGNSDEEFRATGLPQPRELKAQILAISDKSLERNQTQNNGL